MPDYFPEIEKMALLTPMRKALIKIGENKYYTFRAFKTTEDIFNVFTINLLDGNKDNVLKNPKSIVIAESIAQKYFNDKNPIGKVIQVIAEQTEKLDDYIITGVFEDLPENSHFDLEYLVSYDNEDEYIKSWAYTYFQINKNASIKSILSGFAQFLKTREENANYYFPQLQPLKDIHLYSHKDREIQLNGDITNILIFIIAGLVIFIIALINYFNLTIAGFFRRTKEFYLYKVVGAKELNILKYLFVEAFIISIVIINFALVLVNIIKPQLQLISEKVFVSIDYLGFRFFSLLILFLFLSTLLVGILPYFILKSTNFIKSNINKVGKKLSHVSSIHKKIIFRKILIVLQFAASIWLIISTIVIERQNEFLLSEPFSNNIDSVIVIGKLSRPIRERYEVFKQELLQNNNIDDVSAIMEEPASEILDAMPFETVGISKENENVTLYVSPVADNFIRFFNLKIIAGDDFPPFNEKILSESYILNESAIEQLGWTPEEAIGKPFKFNFFIDSIFYGGKIVGIVEDFNYSTMHKKIKPLVFFQKPIWHSNFLIRINPTERENTLKYINKAWDKIYPEFPLEYSYCEELYYNLYKKEITQGKLLGIFSFLTIIISCIGLFGISSIIMKQRVKEIGIRKTNGAKISQIVLMLSGDFIKWILLSFVIACPLAYYFLNKWLDNFAYRIDISWWMFLISGIIAVLVALLTVSWQSWSAASRNPVESLRDE